MILAINGASGVGKTTLAHALSAALKLEVAPERFLQISRLRAEWRDSPSNSEREMQVTEQLIDEVQNWLAFQRQAISQKRNIVFDRSCFDILELFIELGLDKDGGSLIKTAISECLAQSASFDLVIVPPLSEWSFNASRNEDGLIRTHSLSKKLGSQAMKIGLIEQFANAPRLFIDQNKQTTEQRVDFVIDALRSLGKLS